MVNVLADIMVQRRWSSFSAACSGACSGLHMCVCSECVCVSMCTFAHLHSLCRSCPELSWIRVCVRAIGRTPQIITVCAATKRTATVLSPSAYITSIFLMHLMHTCARMARKQLAHLAPRVRRSECTFRPRLEVATPRIAELGSPHHYLPAQLC